MNANSNDSLGRTSECQVLFVCMGNICRSPTAEGVFRVLLDQAGMQRRIGSDSAGTHDYHIGNPPDARATRAAARRGIDISDLRARQVSVEDFDRFDYVLAMDEDNLSVLEQMRPPQSRAHVSLLMSYAPSNFPQEVPDPYYGQGQGFEDVLDMVQAACQGLLRDIQQQALISNRSSAS